ncbi:TetR/AcrR family transcriptional regulator [Geminicoccus flavidas]|uniref:TetR/AcrR family transcriptional regulator n=1 Tax=Geminicoccus flavidas TaxID=2506407 RepID=UPI001356B858|nr:TetR/AcrR family transcriptional regulator [Geminicoccus flavidas]
MSTQTGYTRKKQPDKVRRALLDQAAKLAVKQGLAAVTIQAVAQAAGVTKGGLFHHFPDKHALIEGVFLDLLQHFDAEIDALMEQDPEPWGRFTRAYVNTLYTKRELEIESRWAALSASSVADPGLRWLWAEWLARRLDRHKETDDGMDLAIVRLAADGVWLAGLLDFGYRLLPNQEDLRARLIAMTKSAGDL